MVSSAKDTPSFRPRARESTVNSSIWAESTGYRSSRTKIIIINIRDSTFFFGNQDGAAITAQQLRQGLPIGVSRGQVILQKAAEQVPGVFMAGFNDA